MLPHPKDGLGNESGIRRVVEAYHEHLPKFGVELVKPNATTYDIKAVHAGMTGADNDVCHTHGLYWTADYKAADWEYRVNARVIEAIRHARTVTVPSEWVAETFRRDMRLAPAVVPHGIDWREWQHSEDNEGYILWNKNRAGVDACDNSVLTPLAKQFPNNIFVATFPPQGRPQNLKVLKDGVVPHSEMKRLVQRAGVYLSLVKETFGIGVLEAMAAGVPVLGWNYGGNSFLVEHGVSGYLAEPGNLDDLYTGLDYCLKYRDTLGANGRELVKKWTWQSACEKLTHIYELAMKDDKRPMFIEPELYTMSY